MAIIRKEIELVGSKGKRKEIALFDSGATYSCIRKEIAQELEIILPLTRPIRLITAQEKNYMEVKERVVLDFYLSGYRFSDEFLIIENLSEKVIIGAKTMQAWRLKLDFEKEDIIIDPRVTEIQLIILISSQDSVISNFSIKI
ncbi:MAG: retropepsin-like aspartic protease [Candidatus Calescibacterium sp.]|jgi:hypothetical protein|nr:retropepsin-like aspartic protease [Candidatus Calescibacterium sp.]